MALPSLSSCWYRTLIYGTMEGIRTCMYYTLRLSTAITFYVLPEENEFVLLNLSNSTKSPGQLIHLFNQNSNLNTLWHCPWQSLAPLQNCYSSYSYPIPLRHVGIEQVRALTTSLQQSTLQVLGLLRMRFKS